MNGNKMSDMPEYKEIDPSKYIEWEGKSKSAYWAQKTSCVKAERV